MPGGWELGGGGFAPKSEWSRGYRERVGSSAGKRLQKLRTEKVERSMAHIYTAGGMRRLHLRGWANIRKRLLVHACRFNVGVLMRALTGIGTPRTLQGRGRVGGQPC
ncbi:MAG: transposase [Bryobacterales bacterium]|nr:transposase [Bryobacterales bacterium]